jgi:hypothetical protein
LEQTNVSKVRTASIIMLMMEAVRTFETSVYSNEIKRRDIPEGCNLRQLHSVHFLIDLLNPSFIHTFACTK